MLTLGSAAAAVTRALMAVLMGVAFAVEMIVFVGMDMVMLVGVDVLVTMGYTIMGVLVGMGVLMLVVVATGNMIVMNMHRDSPNVFL